MTITTRLVYERVVLSAKFGRGSCFVYSKPCFCQGDYVQLALVDVITNEERLVANRPPIDQRERTTYVPLSEPLNVSEIRSALLMPVCLQTELS